MVLLPCIAPISFLDQKKGGACRHRAIVKPARIDKGMQILSASQPTQTAQGEWVSGGEGRTLLLDALETVAQANPQSTLEQWLQGTEEQLPVTAKQLYPTLKDEELQLRSPRLRTQQHGR